eukprot:1036986-Pleurochrysis_carterae.AAC.1
MTEFVIDKSLEAQNFNIVFESFSASGAYPPPLKTPPDTYNTWRPFAYESFPIDDINTDGIVGDSRESVQFMLYWFYTLLHHPATKCHRIPLITTVQGTGKNSILKLISTLLGGNKLFRCEDSNQIFGSFNSLLENSYMVALSEFDHADLQRMGRLKHLASEDYITINQKGVPARVVPSYHRFIILTNAGSQSGCSPVSIEQNERRFVAFNGSSRNASNHDLFSYFQNNMSANSI